MRHCSKCGREYIQTRNDAEDVWMIKDSELLCAKCFLKENDIYWKGYRDGRLSVRSKIGDRLPGAVDKIDALIEDIPVRAKEWKAWMKHKLFNGKHKAR